MTVPFETVTAPLEVKRTAPLETITAPIRTVTVSIWRVTALLGMVTAPLETSLHIWCHFAEKFTRSWIRHCHRCLSGFDALGNTAIRATRRPFDSWWRFYAFCLLKVPSWPLGALLIGSM